MVCVQADTDLAMVMLESSSNASEAASRLDSIRINAEASKLASLPKSHTPISLCVLYANDQCASAIAGYEDNTLVPSMHSGCI